MFSTASTSAASAVLLTLTLLLGPASGASGAVICRTSADCEAAGPGAFCLAGLCRESGDPSVFELYRVAVPAVVDLTSEGAGRDVAVRATTLLRGLLRSTVFFSVIEDAPDPDAVAAEGWSPATVDFTAWSKVGAYAVVKGRVVDGPTPDSVQLHLSWLEVETAQHLPQRSDQMVVEAGALRSSVSRWCDEVVRTITGRPGILSSELAVAVKAREDGAMKGIVAMSLDGGLRREVTRNESINVLPSWAPNRRVAYTSYADGNPNIYIEGESFVSHGSLNTGADWHPTGEVAAVTVSLEDGNPDIYLVDGESGDIRARLTDFAGIDTSPTFSPDGSRIAFVSNRGGAPQIWTMRSDGTNAAPLTPWCGYCTGPDWSPTGEWIVYDAMVAGGRFDIFVIHASTRKVRRLTQGSGSNESPAWSPDGRYVVFSSTRYSSEDNLRQDLYVVPGAGGPVRPLTSGDALYYTPAWAGLFASEIQAIPWSPAPSEPAPAPDESPPEPAPPAPVDGDQGTGV